MKLIIFGASGSGTTTLGKALGIKRGWKHLDADDYYWEKTDPPFQKKLALLERNDQLRKAFSSSPNAIISGSLVTWGKEWEKAFDLGVFLQIPPKLRMKRLQHREIERYGDRLHTDSELQLTSKAFLTWAKKYDNPSFEGRSISQHQDWIKRLTCPILTIAGDTSTETRIKKIEEKIFIMTKA